MSAPGLHGVIAEFDRPEALVEALASARRAGYARLEAFSPFPLKAAAETMGVRPVALRWIGALAGVLGAAVQYGSQYWFNAVDYPLNVGGRPLHSWPAFIPATLIVGILWAGAATLIAMLVILRLPRLHHPVFAVPDFERGSEDRFFLLISSRDPLFEEARATAFLAALAPRAVRTVAA